MFKVVDDFNCLFISRLKEKRFNVMVAYVFILGVWVIYR